MPVLFLDRLPLPSLQAYTAFSLVPLICSVYYAIQVTSQPGWKLNDTVIRDSNLEPSALVDSTNYTSNNVTNTGGISFTNVLYYMIEEPLCIWVSRRYSACFISCRPV